MTEYSGSGDSFVEDNKQYGVGGGDQTKVPVSVANVKALKEKIDKQFINSGMITTNQVSQPLAPMEQDPSQLWLDNGNNDTVAKIDLPIARVAEDGSTYGGFMTSAQVKKLNSLENYTLPVPTPTTLGGVKAGTNTNNGVKVDADGTLYAEKLGVTFMPPTADNADEVARGTAVKFYDQNRCNGFMDQFQFFFDSSFDSDTVEAPDLMAGSSTERFSRIKLKAASATTLGGVKVGTGINVAADGTISVNLPEHPLVLKGTVTTKADLPTENNNAGDMYLVGTAAPYEEYFWTGVAWELFGTFDTSIDMSAYIKKTDFLSDADFLALFA